jgi:hypothetical protein
MKYRVELINRGGITIDVASDVQILDAILRWRGDANEQLSTIDNIMSNSLTLGNFQAQIPMKILLNLVSQLPRDTIDNLF